MKKNIQRKKIFKEIGFVLMFLAAGLVTFYILLSLILPSMTIEIFQFKHVVVNEDFMYPVVKRGSLAFISKVDLDDLEVGDIIAFEIQLDHDEEIETPINYIYEIFYTEREFEIDGETHTETIRVFRTHRHASDIPERWILGDDEIIGSYRFSIPILGYIVNFVKSPFGIAALVLNGAIVTAVVLIIKSDKKETNIDKEIKS